MLAADAREATARIVTAAVMDTSFFMVRITPFEIGGICPRLFSGGLSARSVRN
jgi:hypothetical protein